MRPRAHVLHLASRVGLLAGPVIVANLLQSLVNVADLVMVGRLGPIEIAAVGMGSAVRMLVLVVILAVTTGSMALAAQARGAGDAVELQTVARQSMLLALAVALDGAPDTYAVACDSDGIDGSEDNAGALAGPDSLERARTAGLDPKAMLADNDGYGFCAALEDLIVTGPTRTNVNDLRAIYVAHRNV
jgi:hypothetical protein